MVWSCLLLTFVLMSVLARAQVGTVTQDITAIPDFPLQKQCAQGCFVRKFDVCPMDMLGIGLDCATLACGGNTPWLASNDCYCRLDAQQPAQELLDSCISSSCTVGNPSVDASMAGSIYLRYCEEKGYEITAPATNTATTTGTARATRTSSGGRGFDPTDTTTSGGTQESTSSESKPASQSGLPTSAIIGIAVAAGAALILLGVCIWLFKRSRPAHSEKHSDHNVPLQPTPTYPQNFISSQGPASEVAPSDSISNDGRPTGAPPTMISLTSGVNRYNVPHNQWR
jgi:hypothetical protein